MTDGIQIFVLCHSLLQLTQLLHSAYFKSCITTIERRFGFNSMSMGTVSSLHEMGNMVLVVFVSYFGSRVNRPRFIGFGGLLMSCATATLALPHFLSRPYQYHFMSAAGGSWDTCVPRENSSAPEVCRQGGGGDPSEVRTQWLTMAAAQVLFGIGSVPIQPFGISYIDDFAEPGNSALYIAILFSISVFGPAFGYLLGSMMLRIYVDVDKTDSPLDLTPSDPRWVGAWWMGLLVSSGCLALASIPYFFFPRVKVPAQAKTYTMCSCVTTLSAVPAGAAGMGIGRALPGSCTKSCPHLVLPAILLIAFAGFIASLSHNPIYMMVLRTVFQEEKSFAIGVQFLLIRMLAWLPAPAVFGLTIDYSCVWWKHACGNKQGACGYYDNNILRNRYFGLQVGYKCLGLVLLALAGWRVQHTPCLSIEKEPEVPV
nr:solute carrier organic anion transporter family member 2A1-like [Salvelinus alpinus]